MPQAIERLFATPMTRPRLPAIKALFSAIFYLPSAGRTGFHNAGLSGTYAHRGPLERRDETPMKGLMQDWPLLVHRVLDHAARWHGEREIVSRSVEGPIHRCTY